MASEKHNLAIIIPYYQGVPYISRCLDSLKGINFAHIYLVDNSPEPYQDNHGVQVIVSKEKKIGFGAAVNLGFNQIDTDQYDYILILNQDAHFKLGHFELLLEYLQNNSCSKFLSPMIYTEDFQEIMPFLYQRYFKQIERLAEDKQSVDSLDIEDFVAVALIVPVDLMRRLNGFDTDFFMYYEDTDLIARASINKPVRMLPFIHVGHHNPELNQAKMSPEKAAWIEKSRILYLKKHKSGVIWRIAWLKSRLRKWKNVIFARDSRNKSQSN